MPRKVLITGGAGFIGSHVADKLLKRGYEVRALDSLVPQVHGEDAVRPAYLNPDVELMVGDVRDPEAVRTALDGVEAVFHFAARVGVGQSMYQVSDYVDTNVRGTAVLMEQLMDRPVERVVVASSMSLYGEGLYQDAEGNIVEGERSAARLREGDFEVRGTDGEPLHPLPTPEHKRPSIASNYAMNKMDQEWLCLMLGEAYGIPATALRFFNVYGERQSLSNPYTGVLAIFASRLLNGNPPLIFEDGLQRRDFVSIHDVTEACALALERPEAIGRAFNVGSGTNTSILDVAHRMAAALDLDIEPEVTGQYRTGDIRNCFADVSRARELLGYDPAVALDSGMRSLAEWLADQTAEDRCAEASRELVTRGLAV